jgi:hypothetical protein
MARFGFYSGTVISSSVVTSLFNSGNGKSYSSLTTAEKVGLVSYWNLDEASGDRADSHGSNTLTDNNTVTSVNSGPSGTVARFVSANVESLSSTASSLDAQRSFSFWFRRASTGNVTGFPPLMVRDFAARGMEVYINNGTEQFSFSVSNGSGTHTANGPIVSDTNWHFITVWSDVAGSKVWLRIDDTTSYSVAFDGTFTADPGLLGIGGWALGNFDGDIARVGVWSSETGTAIHTSLFNSGNGKSYSSLTTAEKTGLVSYWNLDEASGDRADSYGSNTLTDNNTVTSVVNAGGAMRNAAASFVAANTEYLSIIDNASLSLGADSPMTVSLWSRIPDAGLSGTHFIFAKRGSGGTGNDIEYELRVVNYTGTDNYYAFGVANGSSGQEKDASTTPSADGAWHHVVAWHDPVLDVVGIQVDQQTALTAVWAGGTQNGDGPLAIGRLSGISALYLDGLVEETGFWSRVLTAQERTDLYNAGAGLFY